MDIQTGLVLLIALRLGRIGQTPTARQYADLIEQVKGYLLDQQVWPTPAILHLVDAWIEDGSTLLESGTLSEMAISTELALRVGLALGRLGQPPSVPQRVKIRRQIKAVLRSPDGLSSDQLMRRMDRLIDAAVFSLEKRSHPFRKEREESWA